MVDLEEIVRINPRAADGLEEMKSTIDLLRKLREAGLAGRDTLLPDSGRKSLGDLKRQRCFILKAYE